MQTLQHVRQYRRALVAAAEGLSTTVIGGEVGRNQKGGWELVQRAQDWLASVTAPLDPIPDRPAADPAVIAWAAGFFDGEGCVSASEVITNGRWLRFQFSVQVSQAKRAPLDELQTTWGGRISQSTKHQPHHRDQWRWQIVGLDAARFLTDILRRENDPEGRWSRRLG